MHLYFDRLHTKALLTAIVLLLAVIAARPLVIPPPVSAQSDQSHLYVEPGTTVLRKPDGTAQMQGKVVIDMRSGDIWGFPTLEDVPYPIDRTNAKPPVSQPMYLGRFDFSRIRNGAPK